MSSILLPYLASAAQPAIAWLQERLAGGVITLTVDLGQGSDLVALRQSALASGALRAHVIDAREEFARAFLLPALQAGALRGGAALIRELATAAIAQHVVEVARMERARTVACAGADVDRFEKAVRRLDSGLRLIRVPEPVGFSGADPGLHVESTLWGRVIGTGGALAELRGAYLLTRAPAECPDEPAVVEIEFDSGVPVRTNGIDMSLLELLESLEILGGAHGVGRIEPGRADSGWVCEAPGPVVLHDAHQSLESAVVGGELRFLKRQAAGAYVTLLETGRWFSPEREAIDAFAAAIQRHVSGTVRMELFKARCRPLAVRTAETCAGRSGSRPGREPQAAAAAAAGSGRPAQ